MTVSANVRKAGPYTGNGSATSFAFNFKATAEADLRVVLTVISTEAESDLVLDSDYSVTLNPDQEAAPGGSITYPLSGSAMASTHKLTIVSNLSITQTTDITNGGGFYPQVLEDALDRLTMLTGQLQEQIGRAVLVDVSSTTDPADLLDELAADVASAAASAAAAAASLDSFDDRYLGAKASDPTVDNDGAALITGAIYFNTAANEMRTWNGTQWSGVASVAYVPATFSGDGVETDFTLPVAPVNKNNVFVHFDAAYQFKAGFSVSGTTLTFTAAPPAGTNNIEVLIAQPLPVASADAENVTYTPPGVGAVQRTAQDKLREAVSVADFMTAAEIADARSGAPALDHSAAIQAAIDTGNDVDLVGLSYRANNLTQTTNGQSIYSSTGVAKVTKNANGPILTSSGRDVQSRNVEWRGDAATPVYTGDNVVATGDNFTLVNSGSMWAYGRAVKATGSHLQIIGTCSIYQTADTTTDGYDIEIGTAGTVTLYHELVGVYSSQSTGGILLTDTGSHTITGGQFGKLKIAKGTGPGGSNGGKTVGARITGDVTVEMANANFSANQFAGDVTFALGTSNCVLDISNVFSVGCVVTNNGNANNVIMREVSTGGTGQLKFGGDSSAAVIKVDHAVGSFEFAGGAKTPNNKAFRSYLSDGTTDVALMYVDNSANSRVYVGHSNGVASTNVLSGTGGVNLTVGGSTRFQAQSSAFVPQLDNTYTLGLGAQRYSTIYAGTGTINTSDEREKQQIQPIDAAALRAWARVNYAQFKFNDAVAIKGDGARWHFGVIAQRVKEAFEAEGLDAFAYGLLCYDEWPERLDDDGNVLAPAGNRYGVRYEEALALECAYLRSRLAP